MRLGTKVASPDRRRQLETAGTRQEPNAVLFGGREVLALFSKQRSFDWLRSRRSMRGY